MAAPAPALVARMNRLAQTSRSPSVQAIAGSVLHGYRYLNPKLGDGLDLGDPVDGLQQAIGCCRLVGNVFAEAICMSLAIMPLTDRGERRDAVALRATLGRIHEVRYDFALVMLAMRAAMWLALVGRLGGASAVDAWVHAHISPPYPSHYQSTLDRLDGLLDRTTCLAERAYGARLTHAELTDFLDAELAAVAGDDLAGSS